MTASAWHESGLDFEPLDREFRLPVSSENALEQQIHEKRLQTLDRRSSLRSYVTDSIECRGARFLSTSSSFNGSAAYVKKLLPHHEQYL